jgi:hypothetical protein
VIGFAETLAVSDKLLEHVVLRQQTPEVITGVLQADRCAAAVKGSVTRSRVNVKPKDVSAVWIGLTVLALRGKGTGYVNHIAVARRPLSVDLLVIGK